MAMPAYAEQLYYDPSIIWLEQDFSNNVFALFVKEHLTYKPCPENKAALVSYIEREGLPMDAKSLDRAFKVLCLEEKLKLQEIRAFVTGLSVVSPDSNGKFYGTTKKENVDAIFGPDLTVRKLTRLELTTMDQAELGWHMENNWKNYSDAINAPLETS
jgi:hypothetical protein